MRPCRLDGGSNAKDGVNADFAGAKICIHADACRSSNRTLSGTGIARTEFCISKN